MNGPLRWSTADSHGDTARLFQEVQSVLRKARACDQPASCPESRCSSPLRLKFDGRAADLSSDLQKIKRGVPTRAEGKKRYPADGSATDRVEAVEEA